MVLKPFFFSDVYDIKFVPINISYDRILEESLFAFELLGIPKPKESTSVSLEKIRYPYILGENNLIITSEIPSLTLPQGFFKSLRILKENFGDIYIHVGEPISARRYFHDLDRSAHNTIPSHLRELTPHEKALIPPLAHEIVLAQQKNSVVTPFNLAAIALNRNLANEHRPLTLTELEGEVRWLRGAVERSGAFVAAGGVPECLGAHGNLVEVRDGAVGLVRSEIVLGELDPRRLKAHSLSGECMGAAVPMVVLQMYVNPVLHCFVDAALVVLVLERCGALDEGEFFRLRLFSVIYLLLKKHFLETKLEFFFNC